MGWVRMTERRFVATWGSFALAAVPGALGSVWATARLAPLLPPVELAEWALLGVLLTVFGSISQLGLKPGYMQTVSDLGAAHRFGALRAGAVLLAATGLMSGSLLALVLYGFHWQGHWAAVSVLAWLPLHCVIGNVAMMFHTDLRILGQARVLAILSIVTLPLFVFVLELLLRIDMDPLAAYWATGCLTSAVFVGVLVVRSEVLHHAGFDRAFLQRAVRMGVAVMGGLLAKYAADLSVSSTFRWALDPVDAGLYGFAVRSAEPLMSLFVGAFQMAWGAHVYDWIKTSADGKVVAAKSRRSWWLVTIGVPLGVAVAYGVRAMTASAPDAWLLLPFVLMIVSRTLAFGLASSMGFGQTIERDYGRGLRILLAECVMSVALVPLAAVAYGADLAIAIAAVIPWISVWRLRRHSLRVTHALKRSGLATDQ